MSQDTEKQVYLKHEVLTAEDLEYLASIYVRAEMVCIMSGLDKESDQCCAIHTVVDRLKDWVEAGKPKLEEL